MGKGREFYTFWFFIYFFHVHGTFQDPLGIVILLEIGVYLRLQQKIVEKQLIQDLCKC